jgi:uncharacterized protein (TIGR00369 family)
MNASLQIPDGFMPLRANESFIDSVGPLYGRLRGTDYSIGLLVEQRHCNLAGICHGGMLTTLADMQCGLGLRFASGIEKFFPTISLNCDFLDGARKGEWIEGTSEVVKVTRRLAFVTCLLQVGGRKVLRANATLKIPSDNDPRFGKIEMPPR